MESLQISVLLMPLSFGNLGEKHKITNINSLVLIMIHTTKAKEKVGGKEMAELGT